MSDKPENQIPDPDEGADQDVELPEEPGQVWPPEEESEEEGRKQRDKRGGGSLDSGWSQEVREIDEAIEEIRRLNGDSPGAGSGIPRGDSDDEEDIDEEIEDIDLEIDEEIEACIQADGVEEIGAEVAGEPSLKPGGERVAEARDDAAAQPGGAVVAEELGVEAGMEPGMEAGVGPVGEAAEEPSIEASEAPVREAGAELGDEAAQDVVGDVAEAVSVEEEVDEAVRLDADGAIEVPVSSEEGSVDQMVAAVVDSARPRTDTALPQASEAVRRVRGQSERELGQLWGNVFFSAERASPKAIIVTAARRRDGATQIAVALALIGAEASGERRVALVDFNFRDPGIAEVLRIPEEPGLSDVLEGRCTLEAAMRAVTLKNGNQLDVLSSGPAVDKPLGLLKSRQVQSLIGQLQDRYDHTIIDVAAASAHPDPQVIGALVDGALLVVRAGETPRETVADAKKRLDLAGVRCLGLVLNQRSDPIPGFVYRMT
ncbi:MAG: hypothetical protein JXQ75_15910 [Phycisphaerae bacterium]|nr:hypothetical protein [Phycisphaerae bacterium]